MNATFIGTAGWSIPAQHAASFPGEGTHLERYARWLHAVEINSSFYRPHRHATYARWAACVPANFRFAVKLPKAVTHEARLVGAEAILAAFGDAVGALGAKLGVVLVQLPPSLPFDRDAVGAFFTTLQDTVAAPLACEPRHASWFTKAVDADLVSWRVARVAADPPVAPGGGEPGGWRGLAYFRLHGAPRIYYSHYDAAALAALRKRLSKQESATWCIFDNTAAGEALGHALELTTRA